MCIPDAFLAERFDEDPALVFQVTKDAQSNLTKSTPSWESYLGGLEKKHKLPALVAKLREFERSSRLDDNGAEAIEALARAELKSPPADAPASRKHK